MYLKTTAQFQIYHLFLKCIECVIASCLFEHLKQKNLLEEMQSAYKVGHSTEFALLCINNDLLCGINDKSAVLLVLLDLSAAFDTVDHKLLLSCFEHYLGINDVALE